VSDSDTAIEVITKASVLEPGQYIQPEVVEQALGIERSDRTYSLRVCNLIGEIQRYALAVHQRRIMLRQSKDGIRILTPSEAATHAQNMVQLGFSQAERWYLKGQVYVDVDALNESEREHFRERQHKIARKLLAVKEVDFGQE